MSVSRRLNELDDKVLGPNRKTHAQGWEAFSYVALGAGAAFSISERGVQAATAWTVGIVATVAATVYRRRDART